METSLGSTICVAIATSEGIAVGVAVATIRDGVDVGKTGIRAQGLDTGVKVAVGVLSLRTGSGESGTTTPGSDDTKIDVGVGVGVGVGDGSGLLMSSVFAVFSVFKVGVFVGV